MKIDFGCGKHVRHDFFCIDAVRHPKALRDPDMIFAARFDPFGALVEPIPLQDGCADELHSYHVIEHVYQWEALALVKEWHRLLKPGGLLVLECPNILLSASNLIAGKRDQFTMWPFYGDPGHKDPFMCHRWGYTPATLQALVSEAGFVSARSLPPVTHGAKVNRDMRLEAIRP